MIINIVGEYTSYLFIFQVYLPVCFLNSVVIHCTDLGDDCDNHDNDDNHGGDGDVVLVVVMAMMIMLMLMVVVVIHSTDLCRFSAEMFGSMHSLPRFVMIGLKNAFGFCTW